MLNPGFHVVGRVCFSSQNLNQHLFIYHDLPAGQHPSLQTDSSDEEEEEEEVYALNQTKKTSSSEPGRARLITALTPTSAGV